MNAQRMASMDGSVVWRVVRYGDVVGKTVDRIAGV